MTQIDKMIFAIKDVYQSLEKISKLPEIRVGGWVKSIREGKEIIFITLNDGSTLENLQLKILQKNFSQDRLLNKINFASYLLVSGKLILTPQRKQVFELSVNQIEIINSVDNDYPLQKNNIPLEVVRNYPYLRAKTNYFLVIFRLRHNISKAIHDFFHHENFYYIPTPIITSSDAEGAGEFFNIITNKKEVFFSKPASLTVSGQLQVEALAQGLGKVYTFLPCFRAEKSHTTRHLAEFYMIEPEMVFADLDKITNLAERLVKYVFNYVITNNIKELEFLEKFNKKELISKLQKILTSDFKKISYDESIKILAKEKNKFVFNDIK